MLSTNPPRNGQCAILLNAGTVARLARRNPCLHAVLSVLDAAGVESEVRYTAKRIGVHWRNARGESRNVTVSLLPKNPHAAQRARADARRILRHDRIGG